MNRLNHKNLIINISLSLASIAFCVILFALVIEVRYFIKTKEYLSCAWHAPNTKFDKELGWSPIPNRKVYYPGWGTISSNSLGFRSGEIDRNKKQIIILGDSFVWGFGVSDTETVPYLLDEIVSKFGYQVSNLGVSGYDLGQYYLFLKKHIHRFNNLKQVVLVICTQNDLISTGVNFDNGKKKPFFVVKNNDLILTNEVIDEYCLRNVFSRSYFLGMSWPQNIIGEGLSKIADDKVLSREETEKVSIVLLRKIFELVLNNNAELLVVLNPSKKDFTEKSFSLEYFEYVFSKLNIKAISYIDYIEILKKLDQKELTTFYLEDEHYNKKGNLFLAKTICNRLQKILLKDGH